MGMSSYGSVVTTYRNGQRLGPWEGITYRNRHQTFGKSIDIGEGFTMQTMNRELLWERGLLGKDVLHLANSLADLEAKWDSFPEEEAEVYGCSLASLILGYQRGELYLYLLHNHGPDAINFNLWVKFSLHTRLPICIRTFKDMPTEVIEGYGTEIWQQVRSRFKFTHDGLRKVYEAIGQRSDIYGANSLPTKLAVGILFDEDNN